LLPNASVLERDYIANALLSLALGTLHRRRTVASNQSR
jgi:hypothetical protein